MTWSAQISLSVLLIAGISSWSRAQSGASRYDPASQQRSSARRYSFLDFTLARINARGTDYGECLSEGRRALLDNTVQSGYFWSNVIALGLLSCLLLIITYQHRVQANRERSTAELLSQFEHALGRLRAELSAASSNNHDLANELAALKESAMRCIPRAPEAAERIVTSSAMPGATAATATPAATPTVKPVTPECGQSPGSTKAMPVPNQMRLFTQDVDLIIKLNSLEQQLAHSQRDNTALRRRLSDGDRGLESGRQRNRQAKEA